jgi:hypothetical protein
VRIAPDADTLDATGRARVVEQLSASLAQHGIAACADDAPSIADVTFEAERPGQVAVRVRARDAVTQKEVSRVVRIGAIPRDGRPLALAIAADELLRASWAEVALTRAPDPPPSPPPPEVREVVAASLPEPARAPPSERASPAPERRPFFVDAALTGDRATGGLTLAGVDLRAGLWLGPRLAATLRAGARVGPQESSPDGAVDTTAWLGGAGATIALLAPGRAVALDVPVRFDAARVQFAAHPAPGARGTDRSAFGAVASTGLSLGARLGAWFSLFVEGTAGVVVAPVAADDARTPFTALSGATFGAALGVRAAL